MGTNNQKLIAGYLSNILGIMIILSLLVSLTDVQFFYSPQDVTFGLFTFIVITFGLTFYVALFGYKNLISLKLKQNAIFIATVNFLFLIQFVLDSWLIDIFGNYNYNLVILIPYMVVVAMLGIALLRNGNALLKISEIPPIKKIRNVSLWLLLISAISIVIVIVMLVIDIISNLNTTSYIETPEGSYEFRFPFLKYAAFLFVYLSVIIFGIGLLGIIYWVYLKFKKR